MVSAIKATHKPVVDALLRSIDSLVRLENREINPSHVWFQLIPIVNLVWSYIVGKKSCGLYRKWTEFTHRRFDTRRRIKNIQITNISNGPCNVYTGDHFVDTLPADTRYFLPGGINCLDNLLDSTCEIQKNTKGACAYYEPGYLDFIFITTPFSVSAHQILDRLCWKNFSQLSCKS